MTSLYAYLFSLDQGEAAHKLTAKLGLDPGRQGKPRTANPASLTPIVPVPPRAPKAKPHPGLGKPDQTWSYKDAEGRLLFLVCRWDIPGGKEIRPLSFWEHNDGRWEWQWKALPEPRPLYGLDRLAQRPDAAVIVTEGEKAANAAEVLFPDCVAVTSPGGSKAANKADWTPLKGRRVIIAPYPTVRCASKAYMVEYRENYLTKMAA